MLDSLDQYLQNLDKSNLRLFYTSRSALSSSADVETLRHIKRVSQDLIDEADRLINNGLTRVPVIQSKDSSLEAKDEPTQNELKRGRNIESSSESNSPDTSPQTKAKKDDNLTTQNKTKAKPDKKPKLESSQDSTHGQLASGTVKDETKSKPGSGNYSEAKGEPRTDKKQEKKDKAAGQPSKKSTEASSTGSVAQKLYKMGKKKPQPSVQGASD